MNNTAAAATITIENADEVLAVAEARADDAFDIAEVNPGNEEMEAAYYAACRHASVIRALVASVKRQAA